MTDAERLCAHRALEKRELYERMKALFWRDHPDASHIEYEAFCRQAAKEIGL